MNNLVFCIGDIGAKRADFRKKGLEVNNVYVDNDEVALDFFVDHNHYFITTKLPFASFSVMQYIKYQLGLVSNERVTKQKVRDRLRAVGATFGCNKRIGRLTKLEYRQVVLAYKLSFNTLCVYINCDGIEYSTKNRLRLLRMLGATVKLAKVYVSVSDSRFVLDTALRNLYRKNGDYTTFPPVYQRAVCISKGSIKGVIKSKHIPVKSSEIINVVKIV